MKWNLKRIGKIKPNHKDYYSDFNINQEKKMI